MLFPGMKHTHSIRVMFVYLSLFTPQISHFSYIKSKWMAMGLNSSKLLVGGIPTPLKNDGVRQLG